jgi:hypothetical protein
LAYISGGGAGSWQLNWFDRSGEVMGTLGAPGVVNSAAISPDGKTVAVDRQEPQTEIDHLWLHDLARGTTSRLTFGRKNDDLPVWAPDGSRIAFHSNRDGVRHPFQKAIGRTGQDEILSKPEGTRRSAGDARRQRPFDLPRSSTTLAFDHALERLAKLNPMQVQVVELHSFAGLTKVETAEILEVSVKTVKNDWRFAKAWLKTEMGGTYDSGPARPNAGNLPGGA